ncbi:MAG: shikimate kinase [Planctomycetota bacterium]|jgi:shikimate kinase
MSDGDSATGGRPYLLIGMRGAGKSSVGPKLAAQFGGSFADLDSLIVARRGMTIREIFARDGESGFRLLERAMLQELLDNPDRSGVDVIAAGGGAVLDPGCVALMRQRTRPVWLTAPPSVLWQRIGGDASSYDNRPSLTGLSGEAELVSLLSVRAPIYEALAEIVVPTDGITVEEVVARIVAA